MASETLAEVLVGIYLGLLAGVFPAVVAFGLGFVFKYLTGVSIPGLGVVVLAGALAGISGGLMGLLDAEVAQSWSGITAFMLVLLLALWAHGQGDKLGGAVPRHLTLSRLRSAGLSSDILDRVDTYGQVRIKPLGGVGDIEGYPPLSDELRAKIQAGSWKFPAELSLAELEVKLTEKLTKEYELSEVSVSVTDQGYAEISAAPATAGLSRRVPSGKRAVSIRTVLPTGLARGDRVSLDVGDRTFTADVISARTDGVRPEPAAAASDADEEAKADGGEEPKVPRAPTATGGDGEVTVVLPTEEARALLGHGFAKLTVRSRGTSREHEAIDLLQGDGNQFRSVTVPAGSALAEVTLGEARVRERYDVAVLAVRRATERIVSPRGATRLQAGDELVVVGRGDAVRAFTEAIA